MADGIDGAGVSGGGFQVGPEIALTLQYRLSDSEGALIECSREAEPLRCIFGAGELPVVVERALDGLSVGDVVGLDLAPDDAFGRRDESALLFVDRGEIPASARPGDELEAESEAGEVVFLRVLEVDDERAVLDANHPLAGQSVRLELTIASARPALQAELERAEQLRQERDVAPDVALSDLLANRLPVAPEQP